MASFFVQQLSGASFSVRHTGGEIDLPTTYGSQPWQEVLQFLCLQNLDEQFSYMLVDFLKRYGCIVLQITKSSDSPNFHNIWLPIRKLTGFVKYLTEVPVFHDQTRETYDNLFVTPYFPLGSLASYSWNMENLPIFRSVVKQAFLLMVEALHGKGFVHGNFHAGNVLMKPIKKRKLSFTIRDIGIISKIPSYGFSACITGHRKGRFVEPTCVEEEKVVLNDFYYDLLKFFLLVKEIAPVNFSTIQPILMYFGQWNMDCKKMVRGDVECILACIEGIVFL